MKDIPHKCGKVLDFCIVNDNYKILYCIFCRRIKGYELRGKQHLVEYDAPYTEKVLKDNA